VANRIIRYYEGFDALVAGTPAPARPKRPLALWVGRTVLEAVVEDNLGNIRRNRTPLLETDDERRRYDALEADRCRLLEWVRSRRAVNIFVSVRIHAKVNNEAEREAVEASEEDDGCDLMDGEDTC